MNHVHAFVVSCCLLLTVLFAPSSWGAEPADGAGSQEPAFLTVIVNPSEAEIWVDSRPLPPGADRNSLAMAPGEHRIEARLEGYETIWRVVRVASGRENPPVRIKLNATSGELWIATQGQGMAVEVDGEKVGFDGWNGSLSAGAHLVRVVGPDGDANQLEVSVVPGKVTHVEQDAYGVLRTDVPVTGGSQTSGPTYKPPWTDVPRQGVYLYLTGSVLYLGSDFVDLERGDGLHGGGGGSARIGYRLHDLVGVEVLGQVTALGISGTTLGQDQGLDLLSIQVGAAGRLMVPGRTKVRFGATLATGAKYDIIDWAPETVQSGSQLLIRDSLRSWNAFGQLEAGVELEFLSVMTTFGMQVTVASSSGLDIDGPLWALGPLIGFGYGFW